MAEYECRGSEQVAAAAAAPAMSMAGPAAPEKAGPESIAADLETLRSDKTYESFAPYSDIFNRLRFRFEVFPRMAEVVADKISKKYPIVRGADAPQRYPTWRQRFAAKVSSA